MKLLLLLFSLLISFASIAAAEQTVPNHVENIDLNLKEHEMAVSFLGLSAGEASLIQGPNDENVLVNFGGEGTEAELEAWLALYHVKNIQTLIITKDWPEVSMDRVKKLITKYNIGEIITSTNLVAKLQSFKELPPGLTLSDWRVDTSHSIIPELLAEVQFTGELENEGLDFSLKFFNHQIFFMSSSSERAKKALINKQIKDVNVLKIPLVDKDTIFSEKLIETLNPQISILAAAEREKPDSDIVQDLQDTWSEVYFPKRQGTVTIKFTNSKYEVITIPLEENG